MCLYQNLLFLPPNVSPFIFHISENDTTLHVSQRVEITLDSDSPTESRGFYPLDLMQTGFFVSLLMTRPFLAPTVN